MVGNSADSAIVRLDNVGVTYPGGYGAARNLHCLSNE